MSAGIEKTKEKSKESHGPESTAEASTRYFTDDTSKAEVPVTNESVLAT